MVSPFSVRLVAAAVLLAGVGRLPTFTQSRTSPVPSITVRGRVVAAATGEPLLNAQVSGLTGADLDIPVALTDRDGSFSLTLPQSAKLSVRKTGFSPIEVSPTEATVIRLHRGAVIAGRVSNEFGQPIVGVRVTAEAPARDGTTAAVKATAMTDDRGEYRLTSLPLTRVVVAVLTFATDMTRQQRSPTTFAAGPRPTKTYYPGVNQREAQSFDLVEGDQRDGIDFMVSARDSGNGAFTAVPFSLGPVRPIDPAASMDGRISGRVVGLDHQPLPFAQVVVTAPFFEPRVAIADASGRFSFADLTARTYRLGASNPGYFPLRLNPGSDGMLSVTLADGGHHDDIEMVLTPWGTISGRVLDEHGEPVEGVAVQLLQPSYEGGRRRLASVTPVLRYTDDRGMYRLYGIRPGAYILSTTVGEVGSADIPGYSRTYFPGTTVASEAQFVAIAAGQELTDMTLTLARTHTVRVAGRLQNAAGQPTTGGTVQLLPRAGSGAATIVPVGARITNDGRFEFPNVPAGEYVIQAYQGRPNATTEGPFGALPVSVRETDVTDLLLSMSLGSSIAGHVRVDATQGSTAPKLSGVTIAAAPVNVDFAPTQLAESGIRADGTFQLNGVSGPRRLRVTGLPNGWALHQVLVNNVDRIDQPLAFGQPNQSLTDVEIVLTDRVTRVSGVVTDARSRHVSGHVIVFPTDRRLWYPSSRFLQTSTADDDGAFSVTGLPAGTYYAAAVSALPSEGDDAWQDPEFLAGLMAGASDLAMEEGQRYSLDLRILSR